jgi:PA14 domain/Baseplate J-like protein
MTDAEHCGCCSGVEVLTPSDEANPPGESALRYRVGTHGRFLQSMHARIGTQPPLAPLTTRSTDDPALALMDAWAAVLDVLSFYQERIVNEGYLRTATERRSVLALARAIGYELRPGVAASTVLAFTLETAPGSPAETRIDAGLRTQSIPAQDEQAQVFETLDGIQARAAWNALEVASQEDVAPRLGTTTLYLRGLNTRLQAGDPLLVIGDERRNDPGNENWDFRRVERAQLVSPAEPSADPLASYTVVTLDRPLGSEQPKVQPAKANPKCYALRTRASLFGQAAPDWKAMPRSLRAGYLGLDDDTQALISLYPQWPGFTLADISDPPTTVATGSGLYAEYFEGIAFDKRVLTVVDPRVDFDWGSSETRDPAVPLDDFSARWTGWVQAPSTGDYVFTVRADDGVRLWVNGELLVNAWKLQSATTYNSKAVRLQAGHKYDLRLEFYEHTGAAVIRLSWSGPGFATQIIPSERLYPRDIYTVHLDAAYPRLVPGSWVVLSIPEYQEVYEVLTAGDDARALFTLSSKCTRMTLRGEQLRELFNDRLRDTAVYAESVELPWATRPLSGLVSGHVLDLASLQVDLAAEQWIAIAGLVLSDAIGAPPDNAEVRKRLQKHDALAAVEIAKDRLSATVSFADGDQHIVTLERRSETVRIRRNVTQDGHTRLELATDLENAYLPPSVRINANVAQASQGDSRQMQVQPEILGGGDGSRPFQRFTLRQKPLTYIAAPTPSGAKSTLEVRVDGLRWTEAARITAMAPEDRSYLSRRADDGTVTVQFGDGENGARLPSGQTNVEARYRVGIGAAGNVKQGQISLLLQRPLGLKEVVNPIPASGGTDPEPRDGARRNAPLTVLTLDRIVSLRDFEDFAAAFTGIGNAQAVWLWNGERRLIHLTVAGVDGADIDPDSALYRNLAEAIDAVRPAHQPLKLEPGKVLRFGLTAKLRVNAAYQTDKVLAAVRAALAAAYDFSVRQYGQSLSGSELLACMQGVAGVDWVDLDSMRLHRDTFTQSVAGPNGRLRAWRARWQGGQIQPAEILLLDPADVVLTELTE